MNKERLFIPVLFLFIIAAFTFGLTYFYKNVKPITSVLSKKDVMCGGISLIEALELAKGSECTTEGQLNELQYRCNGKEKRIEISIDVGEEKEGECVALCYIYSESRDVEIEWMCRGLE